MVAKFVIARAEYTLEQKSPQIPLPETSSTEPLLHPPPPTAASLRRGTARRSAGTIDRPRRPATGMSPSHPKPGGVRLPPHRLLTPRPAFRARGEEGFNRPPCRVREARGRGGRPGILVRRVGSPSGGEHFEANGVRPRAFA